VSEFWKNSRVTVTGADGFVGAHLLNLLSLRGARNVFTPRFPQFDFVKREDVIRAIREGKPDIVIHLAAVVGGIGANRAEPGRFFYENLMMGVQLMHESHLAGVKKFVAIGTICAYPKFTPVPFKEENLWGGYPEETNAPYGLAKKMLLVMSQSYRAQYGFNSIFLLPVNLYGPRDNFDLEKSHVIPALIRKFVSAKEANLPNVEIWGTGTPTREFQFVEDCAEAILLAGEFYNSSEPVNLGSGEEISIKDLANLVSDMVGYGGKIVFNPSKPDGQPRRMLDVSRAQREFGYRAKVRLRDGLKRTIDWYLSEGRKIWER
jgi:GDP-L-fucose synthase